MNSRNSRPLITAALTLGIGLGGFIDGIVFHQLLQTHNMLSAKRPKTSIANLEINMFFDGLFHSFTWLATFLGVLLLFRAARQPATPLRYPILVGGMLAGWGLFNLVEGILDHYLFHLHHVVETRGLSLYDHLYLASGILLPLIGYLLIRAALRDKPTTASA